MSKNEPCTPVSIKGSVETLHGDSACSTGEITNLTLRVQPGGREPMHQSRSSVTQHKTGISDSNIISSSQCNADFLRNGHSFFTVSGDETTPLSCTQPLIVSTLIPVDLSDFYVNSSALTFVVIAASSISPPVLSFLAPVAQPAG